MNFIGGRWQNGSGQRFQSTDPFDESPIWEGITSTEADVAAAVGAARRAFPDWAAAPYQQREELLLKYGELLAAAKDELAMLISREMGKPLWESRGEAGAMQAKVAVSIQAHQDRCGTRETVVGDATSVTRFKPHGVVGVFGPYNFPGHLPNGHIVPALLAGNTVVFKPSELTPAVGEQLGQLYEESGLPAGVVNLVQGGRETGVALAAQDEVDGLFFTGSSAAGKAIHRGCGGRPEKILALEMGGNNPLIVHDVADLKAAVYWTIQSAYVTSGQRCTCARRLIVTDKGENDGFLEQLIAAIPNIRGGHYSDEPEPFLGPVVSAAAAEHVLAEQSQLQQAGAELLVPATRSDRSPALLTPGLLDVTAARDVPDEEIFGPLLQLKRVRDLDAAVQEANRTAYGLAAAVFCNRADYEKFYQRIRAGIVNWNKPTTGASSSAPFGGIGQSGNHNPSAYFAADYCSYPVATMECETLTLPASPSPGLDF